MKCPSCGFSDSRVIESRDLDSGEVIRRRRQCLKCHNRYTTYERIESAHLMVVKKDGMRELFSREKLANGIYKAFEKRPISVSQIEAMISDIERSIKSSGNNEVTSNQIGEEVMNHLAKLDDVAYVRFASVYRSFTDLKSFEVELNKLKKRFKKPA